MPIYEYKCEDCQEAFEKLVFSSEDVTCPKCSGSDVTKQFSRFGLGSSNSSYESLPLYKGGGCGCTPSTCGCKN